MAGLWQREVGGEMKWWDQGDIRWGRVSTRWVRVKVGLSWGRGGRENGMKGEIFVLVE